MGPWLELTELSPAPEQVVLNANVFIFKCMPLASERQSVASFPCTHLPTFPSLTSSDGKLGGAWE